MHKGAIFPITEIGTGPAAIRDCAQASETTRRFKQAADSVC